MTNFQLTAALPRVGRTNRKPRHTFNLRQRPWQVQPFLLAPVLPGETMKNVLLQARAVTDPLKNPLIGWWAEYYLFYVKHRQLDAGATLQQMVLTNASLAGLNTAAQAETYHYADSVDWAAACLKVVTEEWFRDEGDAWDLAKIGNLPLAKVDDQNWMDSLIDATSPDPDDNELQHGLDDSIVTAWQEAYERMKQMRAFNMSYEDFLATYGVEEKTIDEREGRPELLRYTRSWQYPSNTVNPENGAPSSAVSWAIAERADKDRFFKEPGFVFGVTVFRPKVYMANQRGAGAHMLSDAYSWLPAVLRADPYTSLREFDGGATPNGPLKGTTNGYWVDVRDLFLYGDQFVNWDMSTGTDGETVALPTAGLQRRYASATDADALFAAASPANQIRQDGVVNLTILGALVDMT